MLERRLFEPTFFLGEAERIATLCHLMAERFARGGRLVAFGTTPAARSDVRHVAVEFVHPVIVGKRALPAFGLTGEGGQLPLQVDLLTRPDDIAMGFAEGDPPAELFEAMGIARARGALTVGFGPGTGCGAEWPFWPAEGDAFIRQELIETLYHVLWELVHVFFDHRGLLGNSSERVSHDAGASSFLYPFLAGEEDDLETVMNDVRASVLMKSSEISELRQQTLEDGRAPLLAAAVTLARSFAAGGKLLAFGNGGSATDSVDLVADFRSAGAWPARPAIDLTEDSSIVTAIANDIGTDAIFSRQIIAYGNEGDVAVALSTSGNSRNVIQALGEARRRGLHTIAFVGYDGGRVADESLADHVIVTRSEHIPRIQEAQASAYHVLRELVELVDSV
jgi:D-sedoheptulose 7-phosphate isomerase